MTRVPRALGPTALAFALLAPVVVWAQTQLEFDVCKQQAGTGPGGRAREEGGRATVTSDVQLRHVPHRHRG